MLADIPMGSAPLDMTCISDSGEIVHQIFARGDEYKGQWLGISSQKSTIEEYAAILSKVLSPKKFVAGAVSIIIRVYVQLLLIRLRFDLITGFLKHP